VAEPGAPDHDAARREALRRARLARAIRLGLILTLGAAALWLVWELDTARRAQNCLESGLRSCRVIEAR
jgi:hypothetical protein